MGCSIRLSISKRVSMAEWEKVYEESLILVRALPFYEVQEREFYGERLKCAVRTEEREREGRLGWYMTGDYNQLKGTEGYFLPRYLSEEDVAGENSQCYQLWGNEVRSETGYFYLLAVTGLLEARLGEHVTVYRDAEAELYARAVKLANDCLEEYDGKPLRCDARCDAETEEKLSEVYLNQTEEDYDIISFEELLFYEAGYEICPEVLKCLMDTYRKYVKYLKEMTYQRLMEQSWQERCVYLIKNNHSLLLREEDWEDMFAYIKHYEDSFGRYYPMVRMQISSEAMHDIVRAIVVNDDLVLYCESVLGLYRILKW